MSPAGVARACRIDSNASAGEGTVSPDGAASSVLLPEHLQERVADHDLLLDSILLRQPTEHASEDAGHVPRQQFVGVRRVERLPRGGQAVGVQQADRLVQRLRDQLFVKPL